MKIKIVAFLMLSATLSFGQTFTRTKPDPDQPPSPDLVAQIEAKANPAHCPMMADNKGDKSCCEHHQDGSAKSEMACCQGKDASACMKGDKDKSASAAGADSKCCGGDQKDCCAKSDKTAEQAAMACCGGSGEHCGMAHHDHGEMNK